MKLGVIREGKNPPDKRVPLTPAQCVEVEKRFPHVEVVIQNSQVRKISDDAYSLLGLKIVEDVSDCDILIGVKEVNKPELIPNKKYLFFSHTYKEQPYNRELLQTILDKKIQLIDYEVLTKPNGSRLIGFGRYAGIVGFYNVFLKYVKKHNLYSLKAANQCEDRVEFEEELKNVKLPNNFKVVLTGFGRVGHGAREIIELLGLKEVTADEFLTQEFNEPVYTQLKAQHYFKRADGKDFDRSAFFESGEGHISTFKTYLEIANMYIACHYWDASSPFIFTRDDLKSDSIKTTVIADISCDIDGPVASTIRPSTITDPIYGYNPRTESEADYMEEGVVAVMAVDNLPCELPKDASEDFGNELLDKILPSLFGEDTDTIIERGSQTDLNGQLMPNFAYLENYLAQ